MSLSLNANPKTSLANRAIWALSFLIPALFFLFPMRPAPSNITLLLVVICFLFTLNRGYFNFVQWPAPQKLLSALFVVVLVGVLYSPASWDWISLHLSKYAKFAYAVALILLLRNKPILQKRAHQAFVAAMLFILISTWLNVWFLLPWSATQNLGFGKTHHVFGDHITQNVLMAYFVCFAATQVERAKSMPINVFWLAVSVLGFISITHLSSGRTGFLLVTFALLTTMLFRAQKKLAIWALPAIFASVLGALASSDILYGRFQQALQEFSTRDSNNFSSIGHRAYNYTVTPKLIAKSPVFGHGTGAYHTEICSVVDKEEWCPTYSWHPHNQFLFFGADHGLLGIAIYMALIASLYRLGYSRREAAEGVQLLAFTSILLLDSLINSPLWSSRESQFFCFMMALLVAICTQKADVEGRLSDQAQGSSL